MIPIFIKTQNCTLFKQELSYFYSIISLYDVGNIYASMFMYVSIYTLTLIKSHLSKKVEF